MLIKADTFAGAYAMTLDALVYSPQFQTAPRGFKINEMIGAHIEIEDPTKVLFTNPARSLPLEYLADELILYFSGSNKADDFIKASKFWDKIKNPDGTVNSAYGYLIFKNLHSTNSQWNWAKESLIRDKDSRQAIMHYNRPEHQYESNKDFVCTMSNQFFIRDNRLDMITYIRSNDIIRGLSYDAPWFMLLIQCMRNALLPYYPDLQIGKYIHFAGSLHLYEEHFELAKKMLEHPFGPGILPPVKESPILYDFSVPSNDPFIKWLQDNRKQEKACR